MKGGELIKIEPIRVAHVAVAAVAAVLDERGNHQGAVQVLGEFERPQKVVHLVAEPAHAGAVQKVAVFVNWRGFLEGGREDEECEDEDHYLKMRM